MDKSILNLIMKEMENGIALFRVLQIHGIETELDGKEIEDKLYEEFGKEHVRNTIRSKIMPTMREQWMSFRKSGIRVGKAVIARERILLSDSEYQDRLKVCHSCVMQMGEKCTYCGCPIANKARFTTETCPHPDGSKWPELNKTTGKLVKPVNRKGCCEGKK